MLVVLRHGKAEAYSDDDHGRQLTERGRREARSAGAWLAETDLLPTHAIVSSARRTQQTWEEVVTLSGCAAAVQISDAVYSADTDNVLEILSTAPPEAQVLALVGHNPTVSSLVHLLDDGEPDAAAFRALSFGLPTAGIAVLEVSVPWADLGVGTARLVAGHTS